MSPQPRGRLTPVDVVFFGVAAVGLWFLSRTLPPLLASQNLATSTEYLFVIIPAALTLTILFNIYSIGVFER